MNFLNLSNEEYIGLSFDDIFSKIAHMIINEGILVINNKKYIICEIEFYLSVVDHKDPFIHGDVEQSTIGNWYFHRQNGGSYKGGSFKGLDLTFGYSTKKSYGGILLRSIKSVLSGNILEGPCRIVDYILKECGKSTIKDLVDGNNLEKLLFMDMSASTLPAVPAIPVASTVPTVPLVLIKKQDSSRDEIIYKCPRVGLTLKNGTKEKEIYLMKNYRYLIHPESIQKYKFGTVLNLHKNNITSENIAAIMDSSTKSINKYIKIYTDTKNKKDSINVSNYYKKKLSVDELCELYALL